MSALAPALPNETALLQALSRGDEKAYLSIVEAWYGSMLRVADAFVRNRQVAEEVVQETWVAVLDGLKSFEGRSRLKTWVFRILANRSATRAEREGRTAPFSSLEPAGAEDELAASRFDNAGSWTDPPKPWTDRPAEELILRKEVRELVDRELAKLPPAQRAVVVLRDLEDCDSEEVCNVLSISEANQRVLLHRGRIRLRAALARHLGKEGTP